MASSTTWQGKLAERLGPLDRVENVGAALSRVLVDGRWLAVKIGEEGEDEAEGLRRLASVDGGPPVPEVVLAEGPLLATSWIDQTSRTAEHEEHLGRALARLHSAHAGDWGGGSAWIGACRVDPSVKSSAADFYGSRLEELARRCGLVEPVERLTRRLDELLPPGPPALVHGDLWWGNVVWGDDGRAWLIDPSVHGGHPEEDLAMLGLFGTVPDRVLRAYEEVRPQAAGWRERIELFQLYPLLVHAVLFGGSYRGQASAIARHFGSSKTGRSR